MQVANTSDWLFIRPLTDKHSIVKFERLTHYTFDDYFKAHMMKVNGALARCNVFDTENTKGRILKALLSFNTTDKESIWHVWDALNDELGVRYIPFASDPFGNVICFDRHDDSVVFYNHETSEIEHVATSYRNFVNQLKT